MGKALPSAAGSELRPPASCCRPPPDPPPSTRVQESRWSSLQTLQASPFCAAAASASDMLISTSQLRCSGHVR